MILVKHHITLAFCQSLSFHALFFFIKKNGIFYDSCYSLTENSPLDTSELAK